MLGRLGKGPLLVMAFCLLLSCMPLSACSSKQQDDEGTSGAYYQEEADANGIRLRLGNSTYLVNNFYREQYSGDWYSQIVRMDDQQTAQPSEAYRVTGSSESAPNIYLLYGKGEELYFFQSFWNLAGETEYHEPQLYCLNVNDDDGEARPMEFYLASRNAVPDQYIDAFERVREMEALTKVEFTLGMPFVFYSQLHIDGKYVYFVESYGGYYEQVFVMRLDSTSGGVEWFEGGPLRQNEGWLVSLINDGYIYYLYNDYDSEDSAGAGWYRARVADFMPEELVSIQGQAFLDNLVVKGRFLYCVTSSHSIQGDPDSEDFAIESVYRLHRIDLESLTGTDIMQSASMFRFDINDNSIYYFGQNSDLHKCSLDGSNDQLLIASQDYLLVREVFLSGEWIYYQNDILWYRLAIDAHELPIEPIVIEPIVR
ncbi:MAG: DUF5050 domain-containing protein [Coriobacteriia bacterium]|nr:DUF5050 domain-containing protein [Coriobacteriia bacterium]